jgi:rubrerythrin
MAYALSTQTHIESSRDAVLQMLARLWQIKLRSISIIEKWLARTVDAEIKAGLQFQIIDERRHLRLVGAEINRLGGRLGTLARQNRFGRPFALVQAQPSDAYRLSVFHRGMKPFTLERCGHMMPLVDDELGRTLERIILDEERHIRWADIRLARVQDEEERRRCKALSEGVEAMLDKAWPKPWLELARNRIIVVQRR